MNNTYSKAKEFKRKHSLTIAFRLQKHASVIEQHLHADEKINYVFCGQKGKAPLFFNKSTIIFLRNFVREYTNFGSFVNSLLWFSLFRLALGRRYILQNTQKTKGLWVWLNTQRKHFRVFRLLSTDL